MAAAAASLLAAACGGSDDDQASPTALSGVVRDPTPQVDLVSLPSLTDEGDVVFRARPGGLQVVYFGYTNCPDVCPTSLADVTVALRKIDPADAERVEVVMVTVDPDRDLDRLDTYIRSFFSTGVAAGTADEEQLLAAAEPFGASWAVRTLDDGSIEVDHSAFLYVVDDAGQLVVTWQFGATSDAMSNDLGILLGRYEA